MPVFTNLYLFIFFIQGSVDPFSLVADELSIVANRLRAMVVAEVCLLSQLVFNHG